MPRIAHAFTPCLAGLAAAGLVGCTALFAPPPASDGGCNPQVPAGYRIQAEPVGTLEIRVLDAAGAPVASASVWATRLVSTGAKCLALIDATTDPQGVARLERMKTGPYDVRLEDGSATASATIEAAQTATVTLRTP